jgi:hypothetical protein
MNPGNHPSNREIRKPVVTALLAAAALGLGLIAAGCGRQPADTGPIGGIPIPEEALTNNVRATSDRGFELDDGAVVSPPSALPSALWNGGPARVVWAEPGGDGSSIRLESDQSWPRVAREFDTTLRKSGWKTASSITLKQCSDTWYERPDGSMVRVFTGRLPDGRTSVSVDYEYAPPPDPLSRR